MSALHDQELADTIEGEHLRHNYTPRPSRKPLKNLAPFYPEPIPTAAVTFRPKGVCPWCGRKSTLCHSDLDPILRAHYAGLL